MLVNREWATMYSTTSSDIYQSTQTPPPSSRRAQSLAQTPGQSITSDSLGTPALTPMKTRKFDVGPAPYESGSLYFFTNASAKCVSLCCTPKQIIVLMRVIKATTCCFLFFNICSELMFLFFVALIKANANADGAGSTRDNNIRLGGIVLSMLGVGIELDTEFTRKYFAGLRPYIPRAFFIFYIAAVSQAELVFSADDIDYDDDESYEDDDNDDVNKELPGSAIVFDAVTSMVLYVCAISYFFLGALCCDRYTSRALAETEDPRSTEIPSSVVIGADPSEPKTSYVASVI